MTGNLAQKMHRNKGSLGSQKPSPNHVLEFRFSKEKIPVATSDTESPH